MTGRELLDASTPRLPVAVAATSFSIIGADSVGDALMDAAPGSPNLAGSNEAASSSPDVAGLNQAASGSNDGAGSNEAASLGYTAVDVSGRIMSSETIARRAEYDKQFKLTALLLLGLSILAGLASLIWREYIPINYGFGWDGFYFMPMFYDFPFFFFKHGIDAYHIQRILPVAITHYGMKAFHIVASDSAILSFVSVYQAVVRVAQVGVWLCICRAMKLRKEATILGYIALFVNFAGLKFSAYDPIQTDSSELLLALLTCLFYLTNRVVPLTIASIASLAVWPTTIACTIPLILFPVSERVTRSVKPNKLMKGCCAAFALLFVALSIHAYRTLSVMPYEILQPISSLLPISVGAAALVLFAALTSLTVHSPLSPRMMARALSRVPFTRFLAAACVVFLYFKLRKMSSGDWSSLSLEPLLYCIQGTQRPLQFLIGHAMHYGPLFITLCLLFKPFCKQVQKLGLGFFIVVGGALAYFVNGESRQLTNFVPFIVLPLALALNHARLRPGFVWFVAIYSLILSRVWLPINWTAEQMGASLSQLYQHGTFETVPSQLFVMGFSTMASNTSLLIFGTLLLISTPFFWPFAKPLAKAKRL
jgi:hypothetical protein